RRGSDAASGMTRGRSFGILTGAQAPRSTAATAHDHEDSTDGNEDSAHNEQGQTEPQVESGGVRKKGEDGEEGMDEGRHKRTDEDGQVDDHVHDAQQDVLDVLERRRGNDGASSGLVHSMTAGRVRKHGDGQHHGREDKTREERDGTGHCLDGWCLHCCVGCCVC
ncbi:hypothetical protein BC831DRAFT_459572, partial [Entophlyctis helioformis]